jgi:hypothetical protein
MCISPGIILSKCFAPTITHKCVSFLSYVEVKKAAHTYYGLPV